MEARNRFLKKLISVISCAALCAVFVVAMHFCAPKIKAVPQITSGNLTYSVSTGDKGVETVDAELGKDIAAVRITDLTDAGFLTHVNYVPDEFVKTGTLNKKMRIVDLTKPFEFAKKGSLVFVILSLDPNSENYVEQSQSLEKYKNGDYWSFTVSLPEIYCASNVYRKADLIAQHGEIENYNFIDYNTSYDKTTERFSSKTETTLIKLNFYTRRATLEDAARAAQIITVHYQSSSGSFAGIADCPVIGTESGINNLNQSSQDLLIAFAVLAAVVLAVLIVLSVIERSAKFISDIIWMTGITAVLLAHYLLGEVTLIPLLWTAMTRAAPFLVFGGAQLAMSRNIGKLPTKYAVPFLSAVGAFLAFICPFVSFAAAHALELTCIAIRAVGAVALVALLLVSVIIKTDGRQVSQSICATVIAVAMISSLFVSTVFPTQCNPIFWLSFVATATTFLGVLIIFMNMKKSNDYLTANLHKEVERQVRDIKAVISERDRLLQFVSHDMKKPLVSSSSMLETLIDREKDGEQTKALEIVKQNTARVISNLSEIAVYAKFNYIAEPSQVLDLSELCASLYEFHEPDCNANGIIMKNLADKRYKAFAKKQGLENVLSNLVINAVEHANCTVITLSVKSEKNRVIISVADDGKGIDETLDVFKPYVSENESKSGGLGLYICKCVVESMNGELYYESNGGGTTFRVALLKA